jgi:hypothetical protein
VAHQKEGTNTLEIGGRPEPLDIRKSNLVFDNDHFAVAATVEGRNAIATLDTGPETTDLHKPFADAFRSQLELPSASTLWQ